MREELRRELKNKKEIYIRTRINPGSGRTEFKDKREDGIYKINVAAPPEKGKANKELVGFLSKELGVDKNNVTIINGHRERDKLIKIKI